MINGRIKYNEKDAVMDSSFRLFLECKDEVMLRDEVGRLKGIAEEKARTNGKVPEPDRQFPQHIMIGTINYPEMSINETVGSDEIKKAFSNGANKIQLPVVLDTQKSVNLFVECNEARVSACQEFTHNIMWSFLSEIPVSKLNISVFDCERRGGSVTPFLEFRKKVPHLFDQEIHTDAEDIYNRLKQLNAEIDERIQSKLGSRYKSIIEYNRSNPVRAERIHLLVVNDFPGGFDYVSMDLLLNILKNGSKCGIYTVISYNRDISSGYDEKTEDYIEQIKKLSSVLEMRDSGCYHTLSVLPVEGYAQISESAAGSFVEEYIKREDEIKNKELAFKDIMDAGLFGRKAGNSLEIPVGVGDGGDITQVTLGRESSGHALIAGAAGSGKTTLLHTLIMSAMYCYSPGELNLYLVDFKGRTEFKEYDSYRLPHIKLLALNAMQEFGEGILEDLVSEMTGRSEKFKTAGVTNLGEYVSATGTTMPRMLVIMDDFTALFDVASNRKSANNCAELIRKIVTEGSAFGIHLVMAAQSAKAMPDLSVSADTFEQMRIRIGLKCTREDAGFLFGNNASKALEMMKGPVGTAVINPDYKEQENEGFRVARCDGNTQKELLRMIENECRLSECTTKTFDGSRVINLLDRYAQSDDTLDDSAKIGVELGELVKTASLFELVFDKKKKHNVIICGSNEKMADNIVNILTLSVLKNKKSKVYCMDGEIIAEEEKSMPYYRQYERFEGQFKLAHTRGDIIRFVNEIYDLYKQKKKVNDDLAIFVTIRNFQLLDLVKQMMKGEYIDEREYLHDNSLSSDAAVSGEDGIRDDSQGLSEKLLRLKEDGFAYGIYVVLTCTDFRSIKESMNSGENIRALFPEKFVFSLNNDDADLLIDGVSVASLGENTVYYADSEQNNNQLTPYLFPGVNELEAYLNDLLGHENAANWYKKAAIAGNVDAMYYLGLLYENGQGVEQNDAEAVNWYGKAANADNPSAMYRLGLLYEKGQGVEQNDAEAANWYGKAANADNMSAMYRLGLLYENGQGVEQSDAEAAKWYEKAVSLCATDNAVPETVEMNAESVGNEDAASAMYRLAVLYENGRGVGQNDAEAAKWYEKAANAGNVSAMNCLGLLYVRGRGVAQNYSEAWKLYLKAADTGDASAMNQIGLLYENGQGVDRNDTEAVKWYEKAADLGNASAMNHLGLLCANGRGVEQNYTEAVKWYEKAADAGNANAMNNLGLLYANGQGVEQNSAEAVKWYEKAADAGNVSAMNHLGMLYEHGQGVVQNSAEAVKWYRKAAEGTNGNADAMYNLGWLYENGQGVEQDYAEAVKWYKNASNAGNATAMNNLGVLYDLGRGVVQNSAEAAKWYEKAANAGNATAMKNLGVLYKQGQGVKQNYGEAAKWYEKAANAGIASAMNNLGVLYDKGQGVVQNSAEAAKWYEKAANAGIPDAMNNIGLLYEKGQGVKQNYTEAANWYEKAAKAGVPDAMKNLGVLYENGQGVEQNYGKAANWYEKAANAGIPDAMMNLAELYKNGRGVEQNKEEAARWYERAANAGNVFAMTRMGESKTKASAKSNSGKLIIPVAIVIVIAIVIFIMKFVV